MSPFIFQFYLVSYFFSIFNNYFKSGLNMKFKIKIINYNRKV